MFDVIGKRMAQFVGGAAALLLLGTVISNLLAILFRYGIGQPLIWTEEAQRYLMVWVAFLGSASAVSRDDHMAIDLLSGFLSVGGRRFLRVVLLALTAAFCLVLVWQGLPLAFENRNQLAPAIGIPMTYPYLAVGIGGALMLCAAVLRIGSEITPRDSQEKALS
jgi:TRAP-type C4-dicarboxylate transport system permease small subunit